MSAKLYTLGGRQALRTCCVRASNPSESLSLLALQYMFDKQISSQFRDVVNVISLMQCIETLLAQSPLPAIRYWLEAAQ